MFDTTAILRPVPLTYRGKARSKRPPDAAPHGRVTILVPAHNEADGIYVTVQGLLSQSQRPDQVIVVADNCTDDTAEIARTAGATVMESVGNRHKKAGALNQALARLLPDTAPDDLIMVVDADSVLDFDFLRNATAWLMSDPSLGAIGGLFRGGPGGGFVGHLQRNEYERYRRDVHRLRGKCLVVTGTAALFRASTLLSVSRARLAGVLPAGNGIGGVYDTSVLTEDNELTFALKTLGYGVLSPSDCTLTTEVMTSWGDLWRQRERWKRGAVENCIQYGFTRVTWRYWGRQFVTMLGVLITFAYLGSIVFSLAFYGGLHVKLFWLGVTGIFMIERVVTVRYRGWRQMLISASMYELVLDYFLQFVHAKAYAMSLLRRERKW
ncbi:glycosyltransferase family 2 protein [Cryptosporangium minutisporangium]|uniref:Glycosyltransferase family 2 protein n=1 Tax=Cryptosporangium minutisporangium TaxID=113569 RepID=A0ABP6SX88_9ACTN